RQEVEGDVDALYPLGNVDVEGVDIGRLARPGECLAASAGAKACKLSDRTARRMLAGQPFGVKKGELATLCDGNCLADAKDSAGHVGRIDLEPDRAGIRLVGGQRNDVRRNSRLRLAVDLLRVGGGNEGEGGGQQGRR